MTNHWAAFRRYHKFVCNTIQPLFFYQPWFGDRALDDTDFSIAFVPQGLEFIAIGQYTYAVFLTFFSLTECGDWQWLPL